MRISKLLPILAFSLGLSYAPWLFAQQYIDIDLDAPAKKKPAQPQPVQKPANPAPKKTPPRAATKLAPSKTTAAKPGLPQSKTGTTKTAGKPMRMAPNKTTLKAPVKPAVTKPLPPPTPSMASPPPPPPAPAPSVPIPAPPKELTLDEPAKAAPAEQKSTTTAENVDEDSLRFKNRHGFTIDYTSWYETLKIKSKVTNGLMEGNSHYFGVGFNYDFTVYREKYGFAITLGGVTGNAQAGQKDLGDYYERRISWTGFRGGGRLFYRANNRIDLGLGFMALSKSTKWPEEDSFTVLPQANPHYFYYLDTRWRLNYRFELVQSFGAHLRSYALAWMLGLTYTLN